jgi:hypothetical protein
LPSYGPGAYGDRGNGPQRPTASYSTGRPGRPCLESDCLNVNSEPTPDIPRRNWLDARKRTPRTTASSRARSSRPVRFKVCLVSRNAGDLAEARLRHRAGNRICANCATAGRRPLPRRPRDSRRRRRLPDRDPRLSADGLEGLFGRLVRHARIPASFALPLNRGRRRKFPAISDWLACV